MRLNSLKILFLIARKRLLLYITRAFLHNHHHFLLFFIRAQNSPLSSFRGGLAAEEKYHPQDENETMAWDKKYSSFHITTYTFVVVAASPGTKGGKI